MAQDRLEALEILKTLPRTNCGDCGLPTCFAFANQVALGRRRPEECPGLEGGEIDQARALAWDAEAGPRADDELLDDLTRKVREVDFATVAELLGARLDEGRLVFVCLGREFAIEPSGRLRSVCHANFWVLVPLLDSILRARELARRRAGAGPWRPDGEWKRFDELRETLSATDFFSTSIEAPLRELADEDADLLADLLEMFGAKHVDEGFDADLSMRFSPHPRVPSLLCWWRADGGFGSKLRIYFDRSAPDFLSVEALYIQSTGMVEMWKRLFARHAVR